ncbi:phage capsid protein [Alteromonas sp. KUL42]|uniref:phage major capsid protein n=1 Tax=Alteromonas sp. KUL42 TaxID=2480797 RepID=UPI001035DA3A|nr:phage major capsid protein [Alteromonas sp. KUL42]TAP33277.1 phage major capsid protein [Alteromonas sp. KUL42]GEA08496.1 phage capsid protein [Alteromonas sp. KUL42]
MKLKELLAKRAGVKDQIQALADKEAELEEGQSLSAEEIEKFDALETDFNNLTAQIQRAEKAQSMAASHAKPVSSSAVHVYAGNGNDKEYKPGQKMAMVAMAVASTHNTAVSVPEYIESNFADPQMAASLDTATPAQAGYLVQEQHSSDFIEMLKPRTVIERMGARHIPMPSGNMTMTRKTGRANAGYGAEGADTNASGASVGQSKLSAKKLTALTPISNDLLRQSSMSAVNFVRDDLVETVGLTKDLALLRSDGTGDSPTGIRHQAAAGNIIDSSAITSSATLAEVDGKLDAAILKLRLSNAPMLDCGWIMSPSVFTYIAGLRDGNGNKAYPEMERGMLKMYKVEFTNQLPENLGVGGDESEISFVDFSQVIIGDTYNVNIAVSTDATYKDGAELVSAFSRDQTVLRIITEHDMLLRHDTAAAIITGVKWGIGLN